jgi:DNA-binding NtrC family response regulator
MTAETGSVLIAEDDASLLLVMRRALEQAGLEAHGVERLDEARQWLDTKRVDVVITDLRLPAGIGRDRGRKRPAHLLLE